MSNGYSCGGGYWAGVARRKLEDAGAVFRGDPRLVHAFDLTHTAVTQSEDRGRRLELFFWDAVWTALVHPEAKIALRAGLQVFEYRGEIGSAAGASGTDATHSVQDRLEKLVTGGAS